MLWVRYIFILQNMTEHPKIMTVTFYYLLLSYEKYTSYDAIMFFQLLNKTYSLISCTFFSEVCGVFRTKYPNRSTNWAAFLPYRGSSCHRTHISSIRASCSVKLEFLKKNINTVFIMYIKMSRLFLDTLFICSNLQTR